MPVGNPFGACVSGRHWEHTHPRRLGTSAPADEKLAVRKSDIEVGNQGKMGPFRQYHSSERHQWVL